MPALKPTKKRLRAVTCAASARPERVQHGNGNCTNKPGHGRTHGRHGKRVHGVRRKGVNGGARKYHELVGRSNSTTTAMALAAVTAIVFIVPPSQIESRIDGTKYLKKGLRHCATPWGHTRHRFQKEGISGTHLRRKKQLKPDRTRLELGHSNRTSA